MCATRARVDARVSETTRRSRDSIAFAVRLDRHSRARAMSRATDANGEDILALERALERLRARPSDETNASELESLRAECAALRRENDALRVAAFATRRNPSSDSLAGASRRLAGFRTKEHRFFVRECGGGGDERDAGETDEGEDREGLFASERDPCKGIVANESMESIDRARDDASPSGGGEGERSGGETLKAAFELILANDEGVEVLEPRDRKIRTKQKGLPHSKFSWLEAPTNALVVKKINDREATAMTRHATRVLASKGVTSWLERAVWDEMTDLQSTCKTWDETDETFRLDAVIDFVVVLGGDGTILWATKYFPKSMPPVVPFAMGSLGFLTCHRIEEMEKRLADVCLGDITLSLRSRIVAKVVTADGKHSPWRYVLNEVLIDRGPKPVMVELDIDVDGYRVTKVAADGVIVATATGSTAYSLAAGGSMVHPGVPALLMTPICPHSLSFRPIVLPDSVVVTISCPKNARNTAWVAFDGKFQTELARGDAVVCRVAAFPVPSACARDENTDWFAAVKHSLGWNTRGADQKPHESASSRAV